MNASPGTRGPLRSIILTSTGQDVRECTNCDSCDAWMLPGMDLTFGEIMQAAARDDAKAIENSTLWTCDDLLPRVRCPSGIDIASVILVLVREAELRGVRTTDDRRQTDDGVRETGICD
jgi:heterodisulfide reductase subunit C